MRWRLAALAVYFLWASLQIAQKPGLQIDEALLVTGAVDMLASHGESTLPHDHHTWVCTGRCFPIMTVRYVGPIKTYLCLPLFAIFGASGAGAEIVRIVSMFLAALGIWGIAALLYQIAGLWPSVAVALILAMNPTYVGMTVFDNNAIAPMMAALGLLCMALATYLRKGTAVAAMWIGAAMGFGIWARANYIWLLAALCAAVVIVLRRRMLRVPWTHWTAWIVGGIAGGLPFLIYQFVSRGGTWEGLSMFVDESSLGNRISGRLVMFSELLLADREHLAMWGGAPVADWQRWFFPLLVFAACVAAFVLPSVWTRISALMFLLLGAILFTSRLQLSEHHLILLLPVAAVMVVLAGALLAKRYRAGAAAIVLVAAVYFVSAAVFQVSAVRGLARTGGVGVWSDAIYPLADYLRTKYQTQEIQILDWGLDENLHLLTDGSLHTVEIYGGATPEESGQRRLWKDVIRKGGVFVLTAEGDRTFPIASAAFLRAMAEYHPSSRAYSALQRNRAGYAHVVEIDSNTIHEPASNSTLSAGDSSAAKWLSGFYPAEASGWRWTARNFAIGLSAPDPILHSQLTIGLYVPDTLIKGLGSITLKAKLNGSLFTPETYRAEGEHFFTREVPAAWLLPGPNRFEFALDKSLPPSQADLRELGIVVTRASLVP